MEVSGGSSEEARKIEKDIVRMLSSNVVGSRKRGLAIKAWKRNSKFLSFPEPQGGI